MNIVEHTEGDVVILAPDGRLDSNTSSTLEGHLMGLINGGAKAVIIDFTNLGYVSSAGLRVLLMGAKKIKAGGGKMTLCALSDNILDVFRISGFDKIFTISTTREEALGGVA